MSDRISVPVSDQNGKRRILDILPTRQGINGEPATRLIVRYETASGQDRVLADVTISGAAVVDVTMTMLRASDPEGGAK